MARVQYSSVIPFERHKVFDYLTDVKHTPELLPDDYHLKLTAAPVKMQKGAEYEYRLTRFGVSHLWFTRVDDFKPDEMYVEKQILGLFDHWVHTCKLEDHGDGKTLLTNYLEYSVPLGLAGKVFDDLWLRRDLRRIFEIGHEKLSKALN